MQEFYYSKSKHILSAVLVAVSITALVFIKLKQNLLLHEILFLGLLVVVFVAEVVIVYKRLKYIRRVFCINNNGITVDALNGLTFEWSAIDNVRLQFIESVWFRRRTSKWYICINIKDLSFLNKIALNNKKLQEIQKNEKYKILLSGMELSAQEIYNNCIPFIKNNCKTQSAQEYTIDYVN